jgi:hypothetical protein
VRCAVFDQSDDDSVGYLRFLHVDNILGAELDIFLPIRPFELNVLCHSSGTEFDCIVGYASGQRWICHCNG